MWRVMIESAEVREKSGRSAKNGKDYRIREQEAFIFLFDQHGAEKRFPSAIRLNLDDQPAYKPGEYTITPDSVFVGEFGQLRFGRLRLVPKSAPAARVA